MVKSVCWALHPYPFYSVAKGSAEMYAERDIMIWDVAAGLALVEGAGGTFRIKQGQNPETLNVSASNGAVRFS